ncbi:uncharacterized protein K441DRAFT_674017 [Cenococcum geophilum 1.58]|uniref:uncharacterized protein n=1 Tax=Cenococcum geophilum 1.58 TaxID=794803 RepID=UPI00358E23AF|nr:hypothetical protein K441DRAFT_674017 [Cenococcum geophilum 1.58]
MTGSMPYYSGLFMVATLVLTLLIDRTDSLTQEYCSTENTGASNGASYWTWQSNGWCSTHCQDDYAFAIVQGNNCWCSNYIPADQSSVSDCSDKCPGFPAESCGSSNNDLFGYVALSKSPSGTMGAASSTSSTSPSAPPTSSPSPTAKQTVDDPKTVFRTVTASPSVFSSVVTPTPAAATSSSQPTSAPASSPATQATQATQTHSSTWVATPITSVQTITVSGAVVVQTVTSMPTDPSQMTQTPKKGVSKGAIAGAVVGSVVGLALIGAVVFLLLSRHKRNKNAEDSEATATTLPPRRNTSTLSKTGLLKTEKDSYIPPVITTTVNRSSSHGLDTIDSISPISERRNSRPLFYDQRLNPTALMDLDNGSHTSIITIEDNRDYTRTLNVRNPDPTDQ